MQWSKGNGPIKEGSILWQSSKRKYARYVKHKCFSFFRLEPNYYSSMMEDQWTFFSLWMHFLLMSFESPWSCKTFVTFVTLESFFAQMHRYLVMSKIFSWSIRLVTLITLKRLFTRVVFLMFIAAARLGEAFVTYATLVWFFSSVYPQMNC